MTATTTTITPAQFIAEVRKVAAERPHHVYENPEWTVEGRRGFCKYMHGDEPGCIIGTAAFNLGVVLPEGGGVSEVLETDVPDLYAELGRVQRAWLSVVQQYQDNGLSWGEAIERADREWPNV